MERWIIGMVTMVHFKEKIKCLAKLCVVIAKEIRESDFSITKHTLAMKKKKLTINLM